MSAGQILRLALAAGAAAVLAAIADLTSLPWGLQAQTQPPTIEVVSGRPDYVTGGDALVRIRSGGDLQDVRVTLNGSDLTARLRRDAGAASLIGLVSGLNVGPNTLVAATHGRSG